MNNTNIKTNAVKFTRARGNLLLVVTFTLINILLLAFESDFYLLFSATVPMIVLEFFMEEAAISGIPVYTTIGIIIALFGVLVYFVFWLLSKRVRAFILISLIVFAIDTLLFVMLIAGAFLLDGWFEPAFLIDLAFHAWILFYLITGTVAWAKLKGVSTEQLQEAKAAISDIEATSALNEISADDAKEDDE